MKRFLLHHHYITRYYMIEYSFRYFKFADYIIFINFIPGACL